MKRNNLLALVMAVVMLMPVLTSCKVSGKGGNIVVKASDPWYETTKFLLEKDLRETDKVNNTQLCASDDKIFYLYTATDAMWTTRTVLDTYDDNGNLLKRKVAKCPTLEGFHLNDLFYATIDSEGKTLKTIIYMYYDGGYGPAFADIDTETGIISNVKSLYSPRVEKVKKPDAGLFKVAGVGEYAIAVCDCSVGGGMVDYQLLLYKDTEFVGELEMSQVNLIYLMDGFSINPATNSLYAAGYIESGAITMEFDLDTGRLKSKKPFGESDSKEVNFADYTVTLNGELCKIDTLGNIERLDINTMSPQTVIDANWYSPCFLALNKNEVYENCQIVSVTENRTVIMDRESTMYSGFETTEYEYARILKKADKNPHAGKKVIELALPLESGISEYLAEAIFEFNKTDNEYLIRVWDKYKTGLTIGRAIGHSVDEAEQKEFKMIQDLKGDEAPDIAIGVQKDYAMRDEVFMDLSDFLDPEVLNDQYTNVIEAGRKNGKLYFLPVTLEIEGLVTKTELLKDGAVGITFNEFEKMIEDKMHGYSPYDYPESSVYNKRSFILSCIDTQSAIAGDKIDFGTEQFRTAVEYAKKNIKYDDFESMPLEYVSDWTRYRGDCYYVTMDDYLDFVHACKSSKKQFSIIGTPSVDAVGPRFFTRETISVTASTDVKDGCRKFINYLFAGKAFESDDCEFKYIVTNKTIMDKNIDTLTRHNNETFEYYTNQVKNGVFIPAAGLDKATGDKAATDEMRESFIKCLSSISTYSYEDYTIDQFVFEELAPYFAGDRSLDDAIKYINDRATKYVREM